MHTPTARLTTTLPLALFLFACGQAASDGASLPDDGAPTSADSGVVAPPPASDGFVSAIGAGLDACTGTENADDASLTMQPEALTVFQFLAASSCESLDRSTLLRNTGTAPLRILGIAVGRSDFSMPPLALPSMLQPGEALSVPVRYRGTEIVETTMTVATDAGCQTFDVYGVTGDEALLDLSAAAMDFGRLPVGSVSEPQRLTIQVQSIRSFGPLDITFGAGPEGLFEAISDVSSPASMESCDRVELQVRFRSPEVPGPVRGKMGYSNGQGDGWLELYGTAVSE